MKEILLSRGKITFVDDADFDWLNQWKWSVTENESGNQYAFRCNKGKSVRMHRLILGAKAGQFVDHKDGNSLNNCRDNLRFCTLSDNVRNGKLYSTNKSGYKGVSWDKEKKRFRVAVYVKEKRIHCGFFTDIKKAALAYNENALKHYGEFARTNMV